MNQILTFFINFPFLTAVEPQWFELLLDHEKDPLQFIEGNWPTERMIDGNTRKKKKNPQNQALSEPRGIL